MDIVPFLRRGLAAAGLALLPPIAVPAQVVTVVPESCDFVLDPGESVQVTGTICLPGQATKADIYLLADTTTSMTPIINQLKANAVQVVGSLLATPNVDIRVGCGQYRDFPYDLKPFDHQVSPTTDQASVVDAISTWFAGGGGDGSEGQFYALYKLATDPSITFRPDAKRIIVWFGDSPAHDPVCDLFVGGGVPTFEIDEDLVKSSLQAAGPGGTTVIAIGTSTGYPQALNDDPLLFDFDYTPFCPQDGLPGQADRIAAATSGISTSITDPTQITGAILDAVANVLVAVDASVVISPELLPFVSAVDPDEYIGVPLPSDPNKTLCLPFSVTVTGPPCDGKQYLHDGTIEFLVNGTPVASHPVHIVQPACNTTLGLLLAGIRRIDPLPVNGGGPEDLLQIYPGVQFFVPIGGKLPRFAIPNDPGLIGFDVYLQCALEDPVNYPEDPVKMSNPLIVYLSGPHVGLPAGEVYGTGSGLVLALVHVASVGGTLDLTCVFGP